MATQIVWQAMFDNLYIKDVNGTPSLQGLLKYLQVYVRLTHLSLIEEGIVFVWTLKWSFDGKFAFYSAYYTKLSSFVKQKLRGLELFGKHGHPTSDYFCLARFFHHPWTSNNEMQRHDLQDDNMKPSMHKSHRLYIDRLLIDSIQNGFVSPPSSVQLMQLIVPTTTYFPIIVW